MTKVLESVLLADIGATNARFAFDRNGTLGPIMRLQVAEFPTFRAALQTFYRETDSELPTHKAMIAVAGPVKHGRATLTNADWVIDAKEIQSEFGLKTTLVNDFAAVAHSIPFLTARGDVEPIGSGKVDPAFWVPERVWELRA
jgi:glucokinase